MVLGYRRNVMLSREELIAQLRHALYLAQNPNEATVEFELGDTDFCFEFEQGEE